MKQTQYVLNGDALSVIVDAQSGGRILAFSVEGQNALVPTGPQIGSTFWPSPQEAWGWPPPPTLDSAPYTIERIERGIRLQSAACEQTFLQLVKTLTLDGRVMRVRYAMTNVANEPRAWAPWEITRIYGGLTFYKSEQPALPKSTGQATFDGRHVWHEYAPQQQEDHEKIFGNGSAGWIANAHNGLLLVKRFSTIEDLNQVAPGEAEVEIYAHGDPLNAYIEMEQQGAYTSIEPGDTLEWEVDWFLHTLPASIDYQMGSTALVEAVESVLAEHPLP